MASSHAGFTFVLNGTTVRVCEDAPQTSLLDYVRGHGLTGAKEGCAEGECGACAVLFVSENADGRTVYRSVNSCLVPLPAAADREIYTVEALAEAGRLADVQRAMVEHNGSQCGYCTPGFVVSMFAEHYRPAQTSPDLHALGGNLCRCTGYRPIRDAMLSVGAPPDGPFLRRLDEPVRACAAVDYRTAQGRFSRPQSLVDALSLAAADPDSRFVAGNTDLGVVTNLRGQRCPHLISLEDIPELLAFQDGDEVIEIGAGLTLTAIGECWSKAADGTPAIIREWLPLFASVLIRNRATLGGNLATASPIGDSAPMLLALDAEVRIAAASGERIISLHEFFQSYRQTALKHGEILRSVRIPKPLPQEARFYKAAKRNLDDISTVAAGFSVSRNEQGRITRARLAYGGVAAIPLRAVEAERLLEGTFGKPDDVSRAKAAIRASLYPIGDHRGSAEYRLALAQSLIDKFWFQQFSAAAA